MASLILHQNLVQKLSPMGEDCSRIDYILSVHVWAASSKPGVLHLSF